MLFFFVCLFDGWDAMGWDGCEMDYRDGGIWIFFSPSPADVVG